MINLLRVESYKMRKNKVFWVLANIIIAVACISVILFLLEEKGMLEPVENEGFSVLEVQVQEAELAPTDGISFFMFIEATPELMITVLLISMLGAFMIATENSSGTIKNMTSIGYGRHQIYLAKLTIFFIATIILHLLMSVAFGFFGLLFFGIGNIPSIEEVMLIGKIGLLTNFYLLAFVAIVMLIAMIVRGSGMAILYSLACLLLFGPFLTLLSQKYTLFETINHYSVYHRFMTIVESNLDQAGILLELIAIPTVTAVVFICLGMFTFQRKDIQ